jgi:hypothetical protein
MEVRAVSVVVAFGIELARFTHVDRAVASLRTPDRRAHRMMNRHKFIAVISRRHRLSRHNPSEAVVD